MENFEAEVWTLLRRYRATVRDAPAFVDAIKRSAAYWFFTRAADDAAAARRAIIAAERTDIGGQAARRTT